MLLASGADVHAVTDVSAFLVYYMISNESCRNQDKSRLIIKVFHFWLLLSTAQCHIFYCQYSTIYPYTSRYSIILSSTSYLDYSFLYYTILFYHIIQFANPILSSTILLIFYTSLYCSIIPRNATYQQILTMTYYSFILACLILYSIPSIIILQYVEWNDSLVNGNWEG